MMDPLTVDLMDLFLLSFLSSAGSLAPWKFSRYCCCRELFIVAIMFPGFKSLKGNNPLRAHVNE